MNIGSAGTSAGTTSGGTSSSGGSGVDSLPENVQQLCDVGGVYFLRGVLALLVKVHTVVECVPDQHLTLLWEEGVGGD